MGDQIFTTAANQTKKLHDPTAHAELLAIRVLSEQLQKTDLSGFTLYTTCEPCPMCMSAAIWAKVDSVVFGCSIETISKYMPQISLPSSQLNEYAFRSVKIVGGVLEAECHKLLKSYA